LFKLSLKSALGHKARLALMMLAIVLGVAFVSGSYVFTDTMKDAFNMLFEQKSATNIVVRAQVAFGSDIGRVPAVVLPLVEGVPGVERAAPVIQGWAQPLDKAGKPIGGYGPPNLAFGWSEGSADLSGITLRDGRFPEGQGEVAIDVFTAQKYGFAIGDRIKMLLLSGTQEFTVVGTLGFGTADNLLGATAAFFSLSEAQRILGFPGAYSQVSVVADPKLDPEQVRAAIAAVLPPGTEVVLAQTAVDEGRKQTDTAIGYFNTLLLAFAGIGIFVGGFLIQNTYRIVVAQRTRELAMLRALGATARQVMRLVLVEAFMVGLVASAFGVGAGVLLAAGLRWLFGVLGIDFPQGALTVMPRTVVVGLVVGTVVTVVSAVFPARRASRIAPVAAMQEQEQTATRSMRPRIIWGTAGTALGAGLVLLGLLTDIGNSLLITGIGAAVSFIGVSVLAALAVRPFGKAVGSPLPRLFGVAGRLAQENSLRKPRRTAATASALMIGVALVTVVATLVSSVKFSITGTVRDEVIGQYEVHSPAMTNPMASGVSSELARRLKRLPEVAVASSYKMGEWRDPAEAALSPQQSGASVAPQSGVRYLIGMDPDMDQVVRLKVSSGDFKNLVGDTVMLSKGYAESRGLTVGATLAVEYPNGKRSDLRVVAIYGAQLFQTDVVIPMNAFDANYSVDFDQMVIIGLVPGVDPAAARPALEKVVADYPNAKLNNKEQYIAEAGRQLDMVLNMMTGMLAMAIVIALLGIANTLALSIMERRREIGLLRAVGMTRRQVRRMVRWEAVLIALFGAVIGLLVGVGLGVAVVAAIGSGLVVALPWANLVTYLFAAAIGGVLASVIPGWRGSRIDVLSAIAYE
jgi:putative ABC transport system permease protein